MKFRFRLEKALQFARLKEETKKSEVAAALKRVTELKERHLALSASQREMLKIAAQRMDLAHAPYQSAKIRADIADLKRLEGAIANEQRMAEKYRAELARLAMRRKALESLREKRRDDFRVKETRREQAAIDEAFRIMPKKI